MTDKSKIILSSVGLVITAAIWGFAFVIVKDSLNDVGPVWMMAFRFTIASILFSIVFVKKFSKLNKTTLFHGALLGFWIFAAYAFQTIGCNYTTAGKNAFLTTIYVILVPLIAWPVYKRRPKWYVALAAILSITGIGLLALQKGEDSILSMNVGDVLTLICGIFYAVHIVCVEKFNINEDPILLTCLQFIFSAIFSWMMAPVYDGAMPVHVFKDSHVILSMMYLGVFSTMIAFMLQNIGLKFVPGPLASLFMSLESVFGVLFSAICLGEKLTGRMYLGCVLIFAAIVIAEVLPGLKKTNT